MLQSNSNKRLAIRSSIPHHCNCMELVISIEGGNGNMKILVCTDGSDHSTRAVRWAAQFAKNYSSELMILNVVKNIVKTDGEIAWFKEEDEEGNRILSEAKLLVEKEFQGVKVTLRLAGGDADKVTVELAENEKLDLIVMGSRGLGQFKRLLLGSISQKVSTHAPCPVTIVR